MQRSLVFFSQFEEKLAETDVLIDTIQNSVDRLQHIDPSEPVDPLKFQEKVH